MNAWVEYANERAAALWLMGRAAAAFSQQGLRQQAMNAWVEAAAELSRGAAGSCGAASSRRRRARLGGRSTAGAR